MKARSIALVCLFLLCSAGFAEEEKENVEKMLEVYRRSGSANMELRLREYEALQEMRRERRKRHLPTGSQFSFARESYRLRRNTPGETDVNGCAWTSAGPTNLNGRVISLAIDPSDNQRIYAATVGGLWRSDTAGRRWQRVSDENMMAMRFSAVAVNPADEKIILAGAGDRNLSVYNVGNGLWQSNDYGAPGSWTKVTPLFDGTIIYRIRIDPEPPYNIYVAATNGVWVATQNNGIITFPAAPLGGFNAVTHDLVVDFTPGMPRTIYASARIKAGNPVPVGIYKWDASPNATWQKKDSGIDLVDAETFSLALAQSESSILYTKVSYKTDLIRIYKTTSAAEPAPGVDAWKLLPNAVPDEIMGWFNTLLEVDPTDSKRVFAGGINLYMTTDGDGGGVQWEKITKSPDPGYPLKAHGDFHALAFDPVNPKIVYVGNDGGIDRSTDMSQPLWHWNDVSHGMIITMYYFLTSNRMYPTLLAGGLQDNGTALTFGNRTWYQPGGCDGYECGSDAGNPDTLFATCHEGLTEFANPVPGTAGYKDKVPWTFDKKPHAPVITDVVVPHAALAGGGEPCEQQTIVRTVDGMDWKSTNTSFQPGAYPLALASAPDGNFKTYLAAVAYKPPKPKVCPDFEGVYFTPYVIRTDNAGANWNPVSGLPLLEPFSVTLDSWNRAFVTYDVKNMGIYMSTNAGPFTNIASTLAARVRRVVADPYDENVLYAATAVGMFRGVVDASMTPPTATWDPFDEGLPDGMEINDLWIDPGTGILTAGSFGFGAFRRDIRKKAECPTRMLVVRDTVYDDGREPSVSPIADAEHPIPDLPFYKPDDTFAGMASWWSSRDIRIDVPSKNPPANQIADADSVEFELCPTSIANCPPQSMIDSAPEASKEARVYVQVTNRGVEPVKGTRVIALWSKASGAFFSLPATFWTKTFPAGGECGPLDPGAWKLVDPDKPCRVISEVTPDYPELARFDWDVPEAADGGATMLTVIESEEDTIAAPIRDQNIVSIPNLVQESRHIALRGVRILDYEVRVPFLWPLDLLKLPEEMEEVEVVVSKADLRGGVRIALPAGLTARAGFGNVRQTRVTEEELVRKLESMGLDPDNAWELNGNEASLFVDLARGQQVTTGVIATPESLDAASRVSIVERSRGKVVGGNVMVLRPKQ